MVTRAAEKAIATGSNAAWFGPSKTGGLPHGVEEPVEQAAKQFA
jgi:hypothetical protein